MHLNRRLTGFWDGRVGPHLQPNVSWHVFPLSRAAPATACLLTECVGRFSAEKLFSPFRFLKRIVCGRSPGNQGGVDQTSYRTLGNECGASHPARLQSKSIA